MFYNIKKVNTTQLSYKVMLICVLKKAVANKCLNETTEGTLNVITADTWTHLLTSLSLQAYFSYKLF